MSDGPVIDPTKKRVKISLGVPMYNESLKGHLIDTMDNAIAVGFDEIVILDDGSTDDTWDILQDYKAKYPHIRLYRNEVNSVLNGGNNRWKFVVDKVAEGEPDWVVIRAADQIYSHKATIEGGDHFRKRLTALYHKGIEMVQIPLAHIWRSNTWYRADNVWGQDIRTHSKRPIWRFHPNYNYLGRVKTGTHLGWHHPSFFGYGKKRPLKKADINWDKGPNWDIVVIHHGHSTHKSKALKFEWSMQAASTNANNGRSRTMPPPDRMPRVKHWLHGRHNNNDGYKGFYEFNMVLRQAPAKWFPPGTDFNEAKPIPESLYDVIKKWNPDRAREYKILYDKFYPPPPKKIKPPVKIIETIVEKPKKYEGETS